MTRNHLITGMIAVAGAAAIFTTTGNSTPTASARPDTADPYAGLPASVVLTGVVRDFRERSVTGGHPDFERPPTRGFGHYAGMPADELDSDGKPVFRSTGVKVTSQWRNAAGQNIIKPKEYITAASGDRAGAAETQDGGGITTAEAFGQWFRDVPGVNLSRPLSITLVRQANSNIYTFNDRSDADYSGRGGFFPINGELFGNSNGNDRNFHFTFELDTEFVYRRGMGQVFSFTGDDDVWVFIDRKLVIDIGGVHGALNQSIELDRLGWLVDGRRYPLKFFFAERHRTQSNFRIDTTISLENAQLPTTSGLYD